MSNVFEVRFEQTAQSAARGRFSIPQAVVDILGLSGDSTIIVEITSSKGVNSITTQLKSGNEIYGGLEDFFDPGEHIYVRVTRLSAAAS